jgi:hypothetical protein
LITIVNAKKERDSRQEARRFYVDSVLRFLIGATWRCAFAILLEEKNGEDNNNDNEMGHGENHNNASPRIDYVGSADSFASRDMNSDGTSAVLEEEQSITGHN